MSGEEVAGIKDAFNMMDTDNKSKINIEQLKNGLQKLGHHINDADLQILMEAVSILSCVFYPTNFLLALFLRRDMVFVGTK